MKELKRTKNQAAVLALLEESNTPLSAYDLLGNLQSQGIKAPPQVYRALEKLIEQGAVHRLESLNAFVACSHRACATKGTTTAFAICNRCDSVEEVADQKLAQQLGALAAASSFNLEQSTVELRGLCKACA